MEIFILVQWVIILFVALYLLIKGADVFVTGAKVLGAHFAMSPFAIGALIVGLGTSLPELASSLAAALSGSSEIVVANVVGSNITNIFLIVGVMGLLGGRLIIKQDLLKTELPIFIFSQLLLVAVVIDGQVDKIESLFLLAAFGAYLWYILVESKTAATVVSTTEPKKFPWYSVISIILGLGAVIIGASYTVTMVVNLATTLFVPVGLVSIVAISLGTSLPELFVALQAIRSKNIDLAIGSIFGSNTVNALLVVGVPGVIVPLVVDNVVLDFGLWYLLMAVLVLFVVALSQRLVRFEGLMMVIFYAFFLFKLFLYI